MMSIEYDLSDDEHGASLEEEHQNEFNAMVTKKKKKNTYGISESDCSLVVLPQLGGHVGVEFIVEECNDSPQMNGIFCSIREGNIFCFAGAQGD